MRERRCSSFREVGARSEEFEVANTPRDDSMRTHVLLNIQHSVPSHCHPGMLSVPRTVTTIVLPSIYGDPISFMAMIRIEDTPFFSHAKYLCFTARGQKTMTIQWCLVKVLKNRLSVVALRHISKAEGYGKLERYLFSWGLGRVVR